MPDGDQAETTLDRVTNLWKRAVGGGGGGSGSGGGGYAAPRRACSLVGLRACGQRPAGFHAARPRMPTLIWALEALAV